MPAFNFLNKLTTLNNAIYFIKKHFLVILSLGLISAFGRVIQLGGFGEIPGWVNIVLEIIVESSRILLFLFVLGLANVKKGISRIRDLFTKKNMWRSNWNVSIEKIKKQWLSVLLNLVAFLIIASMFNYLIDQLAYQTCLYLSLKENGILVDSSSEWTILLFFKNLSVIPFTLVFETLLILWIAGKLNSYKMPAQ
ncbi:MAG TPA: hypothetical protein VIU35_20325 [Chitinophagaceae bacterium]